MVFFLHVWFMCFLEQNFSWWPSLYVCTDTQFFKVYSGLSFWEDDLRSWSLYIFLCWRFLEIWRTKMYFQTLQSFRKSLRKSWVAVYVWTSLFRFQSDQSFLEPLFQEQNVIQCLWSIVIWPSNWIVSLDLQESVVSSEVLKWTFCGANGQPSSIDHLLPFTLPSKITNHCALWTVGGGVTFPWQRDTNRKKYLTISITLEKWAQY